jgi:Right handed beta helix region
VRDVTVVGGDDGIDVEDATDVRLVRVRVSGAKLDQIHVRRSTVAIRDCVVDAGTSTYAQGIDIGFAFDLHPSMVTGCLVRGGREGIVSHFANVMIHANVVTDTSLRAITVTEMSMGMVEKNRVSDALGVGVFCGDHSECDIVKNHVVGTRPDTASGDLTRAGFGILAHYGGIAHVDGNVVTASPGGIAARVGGELVRDDG